MIYSPLGAFNSTSKNTNREFHPGILWIVIVLFVIVALLEVLTPIESVFSYLYIGPILLANLRLSRRIALGSTSLASSLTIVNLWVPGIYPVTAAIIENRLIAEVALIVTHVLAHRNRYFEEAIAQQRAQLQFQGKLASVREDFVATLTHDLKTPLLGAIEMLKVLQQERFGPVTVGQQKVLATIIRSHQSSLQLLETLLDVYRNDDEGVKLRRSPLYLAHLVEQVVDSLRELASSYQVSLEFQKPQNHEFLVNGDALQLRRVLSNLLINAINHSPIDGTVEIRVEVRSDRAYPQQVVKVMDEGPGICDEDLPQLFERFYQGHSERQAKGSGLGLYLSRQIVEAHGGTIWAENRVPRGAIVGFYLNTHPIHPA